MKRSNTGSFILTLPLQCEKWQQDYLDKTFRVAQNMYNNLVSDRLKALEQMQRTRAWKNIQAQLSDIYAQRKLELEANKANHDDVEKRYKTVLKPVYEQKNELIAHFGFTEYAFQSRIQKWRQHNRTVVGTHIAQKIASSVWQQFQDYFYGGGKQIRFCPWTEFTSIEGKTNGTNIIYRDYKIYVGKRSSRENGIPVKLAKPPKNGKPASPAYQYEREALSHRVKYCRIIRRWYSEGWRYFAQLILEGTPPVKTKPATGEVLHPMGNGRVGLDIGTQTLAYSASKTVGLVELAPGIQNLQDELRRVNRAMDRSRRATNPQFFHEDGTVIRRNKLPPGLLNARGKRNWAESKHYEELASLRRSLLRKQAALRMQKHHELANKVLAAGNEFYIETMNFRGLAKKAKPQKVEELQPGEKFKRRKRFGKSIANKAPAAFVNILKEKTERFGGTFCEINTWKAKASQYNHMEQTYNKKKLSQRWNYMPDGTKVQRDLYSAFLIQHTNDTLDGFEQSSCDRDFPGFMKLHDAEIAHLRGAKMPSSIGIAS